METYSISIDFSGIYPNSDQLEAEIRSNVDITTNLIYTYGSETDDNIKLFFAAPLSPTEKTALDTIVSNHVPVYIPETPNSLDIIPKIDSVKLTNYTRIAANLFKGSSYATATSISYTTGTSYDIRIYDKTNKEILLSTNLTNNIESVQYLGILSNLSPDPAQIEISVRTNGNGKTTVESITINYN